VIAAAVEAQKEGDYRWGVELLRHVVYADPTNANAKELQADMLEQMGYQSENGTWRNFFLMGAQELRGEIQQALPLVKSLSIIEAMSTDMIFDSLAARIIGPAASKTLILMNWTFTDLQSPTTKTTPVTYALSLENGALTYVADKVGQGQHFTVTLARSTLDLLLGGQLNLKDVVQGKYPNNTITITPGNVNHDESLKQLLLFFCLLDNADPNFPIVTPRADARSAWFAQDLLDSRDSKIESLLNHDHVAKPRSFFVDWPRGC